MTTKVKCQGKEAGRTDDGGFYKNNGNGCGEKLLPKREDHGTKEWRQEHTGGLNYLP